MNQVVERFGDGVAIFFLSILYIFLTVLLWGNDLIFGRGS